MIGGGLSKSVLSALFYVLVDSIKRRQRHFVSMKTEREIRKDNNCLHRQITSKSHLFFFFIQFAFSRENPTGK